MPNRREKREVILRQQGNARGEKEEKKGRFVGRKKGKGHAMRNRGGHGGGEKKEKIHVTVDRRRRKKGEGGRRNASSRLAL